MPKTPFVQVQRGIAAYMDNEVMPLIDDSSWKKVMVGTAISLGIKRADAYLPLLQANPIIKTLDLVDEEGAIDVDTLAPEIKNNISQDGMKIDIPVLGTMTFRPGDVDKLLQYIKRAGQ